MNTQAEIIYCDTLPNPPYPEVRRQNIINTIDDLFIRGIEVVLLDSLPEAGKTCILSQYLRLNSTRCAGAFIRNTSRWTSDPEILQRELSSQILWQVEGSELPDIDPDPNATWHRSVFQLKRSLRQKQQYYVFIIDGLAKLPSSDVATKSDILRFLPFGTRNIKFLIAGSSADFPSLVEEHSTKEFYLPLLSPDEGRQIIGDLKLQETTVEHIQKLCRGNPSKLMAIRRLVADSDEKDSLIFELPDRLPSLFEIDWAHTQNLTNEELTCLSVITHEKLPRNAESLADVCNCAPSIIETFVSKLPFLELEGPLKVIVFRSEGDRDFASKKLSARRQLVVDMLINFLARRSDSREALLVLPSYYFERQRYAELLAYISPDYIKTLIRETRSWRNAQRQTELGLLVARKLEDRGHIVRLALQESIVLAFDEAQAWRAEANALISIGNIEGARKLADTMMSSEDRLHLLAIIEKARKENGESPDPEVLAEARQLFTKIDTSRIGVKGLAIALDLLYIDPDIAVELFRIGSEASGRDEERESAIAQFAVGAFDFSTAAGESDIFSKLIKQINEPTVASFSSSLPVIFGNASAADIIKQAERTEAPERRINILRLWCSEHGKREDAVEVCEYLLSEVISTTNYPITARVFREISIPLLYTNDASRIISIACKLSAQTGNAERLGPTVEFVRFLVILGCLELKYDESAAIDRFSDLYLKISDFNDEAIKATCFAWAIAGMRRYDFHKILEKQKMVDDFEAALCSSVDALLQMTARHFTVVQNILRPLANSSWEFALKIAGSLNTLNRRERAIKEVVYNAIRIAESFDEVKGLVSAAHAVSDRSIRNSIILKVVEILTRKPSSSLLLRKSWKLLYDEMECVDNAIERCRGFCLLRASMARDVACYTEVEIQVVEQCIQESLDGVDIEWFRISTGFNAVTSFAEHSKDKAELLMASTRNLREQTEFSVETSGYAFTRSLLLAIQIFSSLAKHVSDFDEYQSRILALIKRIKSVGIRAQLYAELAMGLFAAGKTESAQRLAARDVREMVDSLNLIDGRYRAHIIRCCAPSLYKVHPLQAFDLIDKLKNCDRGPAYWAIIWFLFTGRSEWVPFEEGPNHVFDVSYATFREILEVTKRLTSDNEIYSVVLRVVNSVHPSARSRSNQVSQSQKDDIFRMLDEIIVKQLPSSEGIRHDGYAIVSRAKILSLKKDADHPAWASLVGQAESIPNVADQSFVLGICGALIPSKLGKLRSETLTKAKNATVKIPSILDRIEHFESLATSTRTEEPAFARECIKAGIELGKGVNDDEVQSSQRKLVDLAYQMDDGFAEKLAALSDADPAKLKNKSVVVERVEWHKRKKSIIENTNVGKTAREDKEGFLETIGNLHGQLCAGRMAPRHFDDVLPFVDIAATLPLNEAAIVLSWVMENIGPKHKNPDHVNKFIRPVCEGVLASTELAAAVAMGDRRTVGFENFSAQSNSNALIVNDGERDKALSFICDWIEGNAEQIVRIFDPYFVPSDLKAVLHIRGRLQNVAIEILTGGRANDKECGAQSKEEFYKRFWRDRISTDDPGDTTVCIVGVRTTRDAPFHDRYWLTEKGGLRIGTSFGSLGIGKTSEITVMGENSVAAIESEFKRFFNRETRVFKGERLEYTMFSM